MSGLRFEKTYIDKRVEKYHSKVNNNKSSMRKCKVTIACHINPLLYYVNKNARIAKISILNLEGTIKYFPMRVTTMSR